MDHVTIHFKMCFSKLVHPLLHHNLLTPHLQTLALGRRNDDDRLTLHWRTHPHTRSHPDARLPRVLTFHFLIMTCITQAIQLTNTHETYPNHQYEDEIHKASIPFVIHCFQHLTDIPASSSTSLT